MNPYQPSEIQKPIPYYCEKCAAKEKLRNPWGEIGGFLVFIAVLVLAVWTVNLTMKLMGVRWVFINDRTGVTTEFDSFPWKLTNR